MKASKISFVGAGPGNPELITLRGQALLRQANVVFHDSGLSATFFRECSEDCRIVDVRHQGIVSSEAIANIVSQMTEAVHAGHRVVRLKSGDPLFFSRSLEEMEGLCASGIKFEIVPGVASPLGAAAFAGVPLTGPHGSRGLVFTSASDLLGHAVDENSLLPLAEHAETLCVLLVAAQLRAVVTHLCSVDGFKNSHAVLVHRATLPDQRVIEAPLTDLVARNESNPLIEPSLLIVGNVVRYREKLNWFETLPLFGKRLLLCRAREQAQDSASAILLRGAAPELLPLIEIGPVSNGQALLDCLPKVAETDWVIFTSANGVDHFRRVVGAAGKDARVFGQSKIAVIGPGTAKPLVKWGLKPDLVAEEHVAEGLARQILEHGPASSALLIRALEARDVLPESLQAAGLAVRVVPAYETRKLGDVQREPLLTRLRTRSVDAVLLTSSSMADALVLALGEHAREALSQVCVASIGPITSATLEKHGIVPTLTATAYTIDGLLDALEIYFKRNAT